jgi:hypothetical protein
MHLQGWINMRELSWIILAVVVSIIISNHAFGESYDSFNRRMGNSDWATPTHLAGGALVAGLTAHYLPKTWNPATRWLVGFAAGTLAGCVSESLDKNWDNHDLVQWSIGGAFGATIIFIEF